MPHAPPICVRGTRRRRGGNFAAAHAMGHVANNGRGVHAHAEHQPRPPFPEQKLDQPGLESDLDPKPKYEAPTYRPAEKLLGKRALITGGDSGIGRAVALMYAREGADVMINYLPEEQSDAHETKRAVEAVGRRCLLAPGDLTDEDFAALAAASFKALDDEEGAGRA